MSGPSDRHSPNEQEQASPPFDPSEQQALATFNHAAEEIRFFKGQQWHVTNYALIAYAALAGAPSWVEPDSWRSPASWLAFGLVLLAAAAACDLLVSLEASVNKERNRLFSARHRLMLIDQIHDPYPQEHRSDLPKDWSKLPRWRKLWNSRVERVLVTVVFLGAIVATLIILSRIPFVQRFVACISQSASGAPWPAS